MKDISLTDMLDANDLPLKNRIGKEGYYAPQESLIPTEALLEGEQYRFHFDMSRCVGCQCCVVACNEQNNNPAGVTWRRVGEIEGGTYPDTKRFHLSMACNHCLDPACLTGCPTDAYVKDLATGVVKHKAEECIGCQYCTWNCPYGVPQFNPERNIVTKCDMCHARLADGMAPACVGACPEKAIRIEKVSKTEWAANHTQADAPHVPESAITISTTRITLPKNMPEEMLKANRHSVNPEKAHFSLIFMTVLTQLAAGGFLTLWPGNLFSNLFVFLKPLDDFLVFGACGILTVTGIALGASMFHLGRPLHAYKALRMWRRSWLSREVLFFSLFSFAGGGYATLLLAEWFFHFHVPAAIKLIFGGLVACFGMAGIYASAKIYLVPARPAWNTIRTPLRFFLTGFILGPLFNLGVYALYLVVSGMEVLSKESAGPIFLWLGISSFAAIFQMGVLLGRLAHLLHPDKHEFYSSALLLVRRFKAHFFIRIGLLVVGSFMIPLGLLDQLTRGGLSIFWVASLSWTCFFIALLGEILGRYLFFVTVVPKNMPGSFFTQSQEGH